LPQRPRIGITTYHREGEARLAFSLPSAYVDAVRAGGGMPLLLPPGETRPAVMLDYVDALVFGGGGDLDPAHFEGESHDTNYFVDHERDVFELELMRAALERRTPVLAICRGMQELNVALGGSLHARVHELPDRLDHRRPEHDDMDVQYGPRHTIALRPGGTFHRLAGSTEITVNSLHWQALDRVAPGLRIEAEASDGTIEAVSIRDAKDFALGVQWHPEYRVLDDAFSAKLFATFGAAARRRAEARAKGDLALRRVPGAPLTA